MSQRTYAVIGAGAVGGFYGALLERAGFDVHFLVRSGLDPLCKRGLIIESKAGDFTLPKVQAYDDVRQMPRCDVVIVALKTTQNDRLATLLPRLVKDNGWVLVLQNGLGIEQEVAQIVGGQPVVGGACFLCSNKVSPGHIQHLDYGLIQLGEYGRGGQACGITEPVKQIAKDFQLAGIAVEPTQDLQAIRWAKLVWNIPFNGLSVVLDTTTDQLLAHEPTGALVEKTMREVVAAAGACGVVLDEAIVDRMLENTRKMIPYRTSMKLDYDLGRPMEVEAIFGNALRAGQAAGMDCPLIEMLYQQLQFLDLANR